MDGGWKPHGSRQRRGPASALRRVSTSANSTSSTKRTHLSRNDTDAYSSRDTGHIDVRIIRHAEWRIYSLHAEVCAFLSRLATRTVEGAGVRSAERKLARLRILGTEVLPVKEGRGTLEAVTLVDALLSGLATKGEHVVRELEWLGATVDDVAASVLGTRDKLLYKGLNTRGPYQGEDSCCSGSRDGTAT